jgi:hypothetical protein
MSRRSTKLLKAVLSTLHYTGADSVIAPFTRGIGAILMLHHVRPDQPDTFEPNRILKVTPDFLEQAIRQVRVSGFEVVSLDEAHFRLIEGQHKKPFVCFTFDDGYRCVGGTCCGNAGQLCGVAGCCPDSGTTCEFLQNVGSSLCCKQAAASCTVSNECCSLSCTGGFCD